LFEKSIHYQIPSGWAGTYIDILMDKVEVIWNSHCFVNYIRKILNGMLLIPHPGVYIVGKDIWKELTPDT